VPVNKSSHIILFSLGLKASQNSKDRYFIHFLKTLMETDNKSIQYSSNVLIKISKPQCYDYFGFSGSTDEEKLI